MTLAQIEKNLNEVVTNFNANTFIYDFLLALNANKSDIQRLKKGQLNLSKVEGEILWKKKIFYKVVATANIKQALIETMVLDGRIEKNQIRFVIATDNTSIAALDTKTQQTIYLPIAGLAYEISFFLPLAGMGTYEEQPENEADVKAAVQMAKLFDEIKKTNPTNTTKEVHHLNIFLSRLLFCFFAEDTKIFEDNLFTKSIVEHTQEDGSDLQDYLKLLFEVLNTEIHTTKTPSYLKKFPYVNGGLFKDKSPLPNFTFKSRKAIIDSGGQYWASINPDIFGSMIQAVVSPEKRGNLGMHYTSVPNIMKVIKPLFLDDLEDEFNNAKNNSTAFNKLLGRLANIRIFDPACGSGNFLIIAYKELRLLEIKILLALNGNTNNTITGFEEKQTALFANQQLTLNSQLPIAQMELFSRIELNHFFGIELDDFAHEVAKLSLWLAQHQMNIEFNKLVSGSCNTLPLSDAGVIKQGNATRLNWETVCPKPKLGEVFILGNPPYLGAKELDTLQKEDVSLVFSELGNVKRMDYIGCWFKKASDYIINSNYKYAFVSTDSITQGEQVELIWPYIFSLKQNIFFGYKSFKWRNNAKENAGVSVVVVGIEHENKLRKNKRIFNDKTINIVNTISPYLTSGSSTFMNQRSKPLSEFPKMILGSSGFDGGYLMLDELEKENILTIYPEAKKFIRKFLSGDDFLNDKIRYCIWIEDNLIYEATAIPPLLERINKCRDFRMGAGRDAQKAAKVPHRFFYRTHTESTKILFPKTTSGRRKYVPLDFIKKDVIISNASFVIDEADNVIFAILSSRLHNIWMGITSAKMNTSFRYSVNLTYNTFPFPQINEFQKTELESHVHHIREQRGKHTQKTLAELYDPEKMPEGLLTAHQNLDIAIEKCYRDKPFENDEERLAHLFKLYEEMIAAEPLKGTLFEGEAKIKKSKKK
jgi:hypothetical protein